MQQRQAANLRIVPLSHGIFQLKRPLNEHVHTQWYQEMGYRAKELLAVLPAQCSHRRRTSQFSPFLEEGEQNDAEGSCSRT